MNRNGSSKIRLQRPRPSGSSVNKLERWKSIASIASAIAIPFVLAIVGYFIQKQLADEGLKKDYVSIAAGILKENSAGQEPDLRKWAVEVLEKNSPIPFTPNAKRSLEQGIPLVVPGPALPQPFEACMQAPKERTVGKALARLEASVKRGNTNNEPIETVLSHFMRFVDIVVAQEAEAGQTDASLRCMQSWATMVVEGDNEWRKSIGAPDSKSVYERLRKEKEAADKEQKDDAPPQTKASR